MRPTIDLKPLERCGVRCSRRPRTLEQRDGISLHNFGAGLARAERQQDGNEAAHDMRVAVAADHQRRLAAAGLGNRRRQPNLAGAARDFVLIILQHIGKRLEHFAKFDDIAVAVLPIVEQGEVFDDVVDRRHVSTIPSTLSRSRRWRDATRNNCRHSMLAARSSAENPSTFSCAGSAPSASKSATTSVLPAEAA